MKLNRTGGFSLKTLYLFLLMTLQFNSMAENGEMEPVRCDVERMWRFEFGWEINETSLVEALKLDWKTQLQRQKAWSRQLRADYETGRLSKDDYEAIRSEMKGGMMIRNAALDIIAAYQYQSPEIDRLTMKIYAENMDDEKLRMKCIDVMLNNFPEKGLKMLQQYMDDENRISFRWRLLAASEMLAQGLAVDQTWIDRALASSNKLNHTTAQFMQQKLAAINHPSYRSPPTPKTIFPPPAPTTKRTSASRTSPKQIFGLETNHTPAFATANSARFQPPRIEEVAGESVSPMPIKEKRGIPWQPLLLILGVFASGLMILHFIQRKGK